MTRPGSSSAGPVERLMDGASAILDAPEGVPAVWGERATVAWAVGQPTILAGHSGVYKTTLAQQLVLRRLGLRQPALLGLPVVVDERRVLYIAADRPGQAMASFRRMVDEADRETLRERLRIWKGPLPFVLTGDHTQLLEFASGLGAGTVVIDSLKDVVGELNTDEAGIRINRSIQELIAGGIDTLILHHLRKTAPPRPGLADVYGSTFITAGAGSVFVVAGEAGDPLVELRHVKQPSEEIGPLTVVSDVQRGTVDIHRPVDLSALLGENAEGLTVRRAAEAIFGTAQPSNNEIEKARRRLERLVHDDVAERSGADPVLYRPTPT